MRSESIILLKNHLKIVDGGKKGEKREKWEWRY